MNPADILKRVEAIELLAGDPERAHEKEDKLHQDVLAAIADGHCEHPDACASAALTSLLIGFSRWYA